MARKRKIPGVWGWNPQPNTLLFLLFRVVVASSCLVLFPIACLVFRRSRFAEELALLIVIADHMRPVANGSSPIEKFMDGHRTADQRGAPLGPFQLEHVMIENDRVVAVHRALMLNREDPLQIPPRRPYEGGAGSRGQHGELLVELVDVDTPQELIGCLDLGDSA